MLGAWVAAESTSGVGTVFLCCPDGVTKEMPVKATAAQRPDDVEAGRVSERSEFAISLRGHWHHQRGQQVPCFPLRITLDPHRSPRSLLLRKDLPLMHRFVHFPTGFKPETAPPFAQTQPRR
jgi:hypothetical protein